MREVCLQGEVGASWNFEHSHWIEPSLGRWRLGQAPLSVTLATAGYPCGLYLPTLGAFSGYTLGLGKVVFKLSVPRAVLTGRQRYTWLPGEVWSLEPDSHASASLLVTDMLPGVPISNSPLSGYRALRCSQLFSLTPMPMSFGFYLG